jgi:tetratricopeptide (TPR) repeat protein
MKKLFLIITLIFIIPLDNNAFAQQNKMDSLIILLKTAKEDTNKVNILNLLSDELCNIGLNDSAIRYANQAILLANSINGKVWLKGAADGYSNLALVYYHQGNYPEAIKNQTILLKIRRDIGDKYGMAASYGNTGNIYYRQGNYPEALKSYFSALKAFEEIKFNEGIAGSYENIGLIYQRQGDYVQALKNFSTASEISKKINDMSGISEALTNIGVTYSYQKKYTEALRTHLAALKIDEEISDNKQAIAMGYYNLGDVYAHLGNYTEALQNHFTSLKIREEIDDKAGITSSYNHIGIVYMYQHKTIESNSWLQKGLQLAKELGIKEDIKESYKNLTKADSVLNDYKAAFEHHKLYILYRDSLNNEETKKKSLQATMQYEYDKKEIANKAEQDKLDAINAEEKKKQQIVIYAVAGLLVLVGVFAIFMYNRFRITKKQKSVIEEQKVLVDKAYESLHEKNKEVIDSIRYAKRIQTALITSEKSIEKSLNRLMKNN